MTSLEIRELEPALLDDWLALFDGDAFADNPYWSGCYCYFYHSPDHDWDASNEAGPPHRNAMAERIRVGNQNGLLAYIDGAPIGWCNAGPRESYTNLRGYGTVLEDMAGVGSIMCFVISPAFRGRGVATALTTAVCERFRRDGLSVAEAFPSSVEPRADLPWSAARYKGPLSMYLACGFTVHREYPNFAVVRRDLTA